ncbi:MAG: nucleotidyltransferase family protein [Candidatus Omnitrophica bacterium]|nr:nucleotidyltransferase family protein [Candidatus Omnitrophota bacterium]
MLPVLNFQEKFFLKNISSTDFKETIFNNNIEFVDFLKNNKLEVLMYSLSLQKKITLPIFLKEKFQNNYIINLQKQLQQLKDTINITEILNKKNIPFIILKGPILAKKIYNDEGARRASCDVDILIKNVDFLKVNEALEENGYKNYTKYSSLDLDYRCFMYYKKNTTPVDIHLKVLSGIMFLDLFLPLNEDCWKDFYLESIWNTTIKYFSNELLAIYIAMLFTKENLKIARFQYLVDFYFLIKNYREKLNYYILAKYLNKSKLNFYFLFTLDLLKRYTDLDLPTQFLNEIKLNKIRTKIVYWGLIRYFKVDYKKNIRFLFYGSKIIAFSGGYLNLILKQISYIYKVSYLYFLKDYNLDDGWLSHIKHVNFFIKRLVSSKPRNKTAILYKVNYKSL